MEGLESRICPSALNFGAVLVTPSDPLTLGPDRLIELTSGKALVYVTDLNDNGHVDIQDIAGISVTQRINLTSFVDIHGDIVTNLTKKGVLSGELRDGSVLLAKANIGSLNIVAGTTGEADNVLGEGIVEGQILAGGEIGNAVVVDANGVTTRPFSIVIDGSVQLIAAGTAAGGRDIFANVDAIVGGVHIGPVTLEEFVQSSSGPSIQGVQIGSAAELTLIQAGDAGPGGSGGSLRDIEIAGVALPFSLIAGDGGSANKAGAGGEIRNVTLTGGSVDGDILIRAGAGGDNLGAKNGGTGGVLAQLSLDSSGNFSILAGDGGDGGANGTGGAGGSLRKIELDSGTGYTITAGNGGDGGRAGGAGGIITDLTNNASVAATAAPTFILSADFDKDGATDLLTVSAESNNFTIFLNDGLGNFTPSASFATGLDPQRAAVIDVDGDGNLDVFVANREDDTVSAFLGNGDGTFDPPETLTVGDGPVSVALGQVNGATDSLLDLIVVNSFDGTITILFGTGGGDFNTTSPAVITISDTGLPGAFTIGDLDFTGDLDIAVVNPDLLNADEDNVVFFLGNGPSLSGDGSFTGPQNLIVGNFPVDITSAFLNFGSILDLVVVNQDDDTISVLFGNGGFPVISYQPAVVFDVGSFPSAVTLAQLNGDGRLDIIVANTADNTVSVLLSSGSSGFGAATDFEVGLQPVSLTSGDYNDDGFQDVAVANTGSNNISILFGKGDGTFTIAGESTDAFILRAGDGGDSASGNGGHGGFIGRDISKPEPVLQLPNVAVAALGAAGSVQIAAGSGGDGFINGGKGGGIVTVDIKSSTTSLLQAGDGGAGTTGTGGDGGTIGNNAADFDITMDVSSSEAPTMIVTGTGGDGATRGGAAGKLTNGQFQVSGEVEVRTGAGGDVTATGAGGAGGDVSGSEFIAVGKLTVTTGAGGDSIGANGASGGSVTFSNFELSGTSEIETPVFPPVPNVLMTLGDGGMGSIGGDGGRLRNSTVLMTITTIGIGGNLVTSNELLTQIHTGSGGAGATRGGNGGEVLGLKIDAEYELFVPELDILIVDAYLDLGAGGAGGSIGGNGGFVENLQVTGVTGDVEVNNLTGGTHGAGGDGGITGGSGGSVRGVEVIHGLAQIGGTLTLRGGDGGDGSATAGAGGVVEEVSGEFQGIVQHHDGSFTFGLRLIGGGGGDSSAGAGGAGGRVSGASLSSAVTDISFVGGNGGFGSTLGGAGGELNNLTANSADALSFQAGNGGAATGLGGTGGNGGKVSAIFQSANPGQVIRQVVAGAGGDAPGLGGVAGAGGSIDNVTTLGDIGDFSLEYGFNKMGGLFAGAGGIGAGADGANGDITNVQASRIASIVAGTGSGPVAVRFLDNITANVIGANTDGAVDPGEFIFPAFDFHDTNGDLDFTLGADPNHDPAEEPIDGLILADVIGTINLPTGVLALFTYEVSAPPPVGNIDPQP